MREIADIHEPLMAFLRKRGIPFIRHRSDRKSGIAKGWPDFTVIWQGKAICLEAKVIGGKLSPEQEEQILLIRGSGTPCYVIHSAEEGIRHVQTALGLENAATEPLERQKGCFSKAGDAQLTRKMYPVVEPAATSAKFRIAKILGTDWVIAPDAEGVWDRIRRASAVDIANFQRVNP